MRITYRVFLVGGIPIAIAAAIAAVAWILLNEAERARSGAVLAGATYRNLLIAMIARDEYINASPANRGPQVERFNSYARDARGNLEQLAAVARAPALRDAAAASQEALTRYVDSMSAFIQSTVEYDRLLAEMAERVAQLIALSEEARERQRSSNADIIATLRERDAGFRLIRRLVDSAEELRTAVVSAELHAAMLLLTSRPGITETRERQLAFDLTRLGHAVAVLEATLGPRDPPAIATLKALWADYETAINGFLNAGPQRILIADHAISGAGQRIAEWSDRLLKVKTTEQRALYEEIAQLVAYSVEANETERTTQNVALEVLKLGQRTAAALSQRDTQATSHILQESASLAERVASLPISPLIQSEMIDAVDQWRDGLSNATEVLRQQNARIAEMDGTAVTMVQGARALNDLFTSDAEKIGDTIRNILIFGAAAGLLFGAATAYVVARSITRPLLRVQQGMVDLAADPLARPIADADRRDELGEMARAANFFVAEIGKREQALMRAKERADSALTDLQRAQADLIQAEKLASLGQLVAGVAHEINTPIGIALTTGTQLAEEVQRFNRAAGSGQLRRSDLKRLTERMSEGATLLFANLNRAAELVHSFKQVAADQAGGGRRSFDMRTWLDELTTSLGPALRRSGHVLDIHCRDGLEMNTYPGALGQVLTNLIMNALTHAYDEGQVGRMTLVVDEPAADMVRIVFRDDGRGIAPAFLHRVFDPFFTTGRSRGSTGLGLHIVYNLVTNTLHGKIDIDSTPGSGTIFVIELPVSLDAEADHHVPVEA
ncbi:HAMP domain-containing protein [Tepidamorphus gemmatus]|jgi:signal transduction histidine kinase|uniref:histidine kinase n=1 Tax=Tepidamorphus gemmatus TaxID=747076 RepID=A0A4R3ME99_9HYPH|nr:HAMP domain-containing sensor histidine kinase [Tepidamorphus gemmatus]TCT10629.1 HAMP domain-containing protein [Tepidamorphus gemmatus]